MTKRHSGCPLCGGKLTSLDLLDACDEFADADLGVLSARCPFCQGLLEIRPADGCIEIGYVVGGAGNRRFDVAFSLPLDGLTVESGEAASLQLRSPERTWVFRQ